MDVTHRESGQQFRFRIYDIGKAGSQDCQVAFDDPAKNFDFQRPERVQREPQAAK
jgi:hypothetical protein